jgi:hypothetical protein
MKRFVQLLLLPVFFFLIMPASSFAQEADSTNGVKEVQLVKITMKSGSVYKGYIIDQTPDYILLKTEDAGTLKLDKDLVKSIDFLEGDKYSKNIDWFDNPLTFRYILSASAFNLRKKEVTYRNIGLFFNSFDWGVTDWFQIGAGFEFITTILGRPVFYINPKVSVPVGKDFRAGANVVYANAADFIGEFSGILLMEGVGTYGNEDRNITGGVGFLYVDGQFSRNPFFSISGMYRISNRLSLISENHILPVGSAGSYYPVFSYGVRFLGETLAVNLVLVNSPDIAQFIPLGFPFVDFTIHIGKK